VTPTTSAKRIDPSEKIKELSANTVVFITCRVAYFLSVLVTDKVSIVLYTRKLYNSYNL
jgi:hypothetical protein